MERVGVIVVRRPYITALTGLSVPERKKRRREEEKRKLYVRNEEMIIIH